MDRPLYSIETHFEAPGSLPRPRIIGRAVRLLLGLVLLWAVYGLLVVGWGLFVQSGPPRDWSWWILIAAAVWWTPYVINIGFGHNWKRKPQWAIAVAAGLLVVVDVLVYGTWWAAPLGTFVWLWLLYFSAHLGISFILSAFLGTPGCEMRGIPHLWTVVTGRPSREHYCPGFLDRLDRWERRTPN